MDVAAKKHTLRLVPYGLYLAGFRRADGRQGVNLVSWFTQTSFNPPRVVLGLHREGSAYESVRETGVLALNVLGAGQTDVLRAFYKHVDVVDRKAGALEVRVGENGCPLLPALPASLELALVEEVAGGDHATCVFEVTAAHVWDERKALSHGEAGLHYAG